MSQVIEWPYNANCSSCKYATLITNEEESNGHSQHLCEASKTIIFPCPGFYDQTVTLVPSGYDWICLSCESTNHIDTSLKLKDKVECDNCMEEFYYE